MQNYKNKIKKFKESASTTLSIKSKIKFISDNENLIDDYDLEDLFFTIIGKKFKDEFDLYIHNNKYGDFEISSLDFKIVDVSSYAELKKSFNEFQNSNILNKDDQNLKYKMNWVNDSFYNKENGVLQGTRQSSFADLFYLLDYVINNNLEKDLTKAYKIKDNSIDKWNPYGKSIASFIKDTAPVSFKLKEFGKVEIKTFKNGKIILKGLDSKQIEKLNYVFEIFK